MKKIVGICGLIGHGKDTVAGYLIENEFQRVTFAGVLKDACANIFGWDRILLEGNTSESRVFREQVDEWWAKRLGIPNFTPRYALQHVGTDVFRTHFHPDIWVAACERQVEMTDKNVVISGGGDSALDWTIELAKIAKRVTLVHRRNEFRGASDSVEKVQKLKNDNKIDLITPAEVYKLKGSKHLEKVLINKENEEIEISADFFIPLFGLTPKLGSISDWGLEIEKNSIVVNNSLDYQTNIPGVFAIGDINTYPGKLNLILCGFHEAALMCQAAFKIINPDKKFILKYTTVSGVAGFDGSLKKAEGSVVKSIK